MNNYDVLTRRLKELNLSLEKLFKVISPSDNDEVFIYTSQMDGLGTWQSDFDVYVLVEKYNENLNYTHIAQKHRVRAIDLGTDSLGIQNISYLSVDAEYLEKEYIEYLFKKINNKEYIPTELLKVLYRIKTGVSFKAGRLVDESELSNRITSIELNDYSAWILAIDSDGFLHDSVVLYKDGDYYGSIICARYALNIAIAAYNAKHGVVNLNPHKWSNRIFIKNNAFNNKEIYDKYRFLQFGEIDEENANQICYELIMFIQDLLGHVVGFEAREHWLEKTKYKQFNDIEKYKF